MDDNIIDTVQSILGADVKIVDCEKTTSVSQEEILLINGVPIKLDGIPVDDADAIKTALMGGHVPSVELLNQMLYQAGLLQQAVELETTVSVKSSVVTTEEVSVSRHGRLLDERVSKTEEDSIMESHSKEKLQPISYKCPPKLEHLTRLENSIDSSPSTKGAAPLQKSATHTGNVNVLKNDSTSTCEGLSTLSNYSTYRNCNNGSEFSSANSKNTLQSNTSNISNTTITLGRNASLSCDSGHDGVFNSASHGVPYLPQSKAARTAGNSLSSCFDVVSSADEADLAKSPRKKNSQEDSNQVKIFTYRKPQTSTMPTDSVIIHEDEALVYCNEKLISGSLNALITHLVAKDNYSPDTEFIFDLLLSIKHFMPLTELLAKISQIWEQQQREFKVTTYKRFERTNSKSTGRKTSVESSDSVADSASNMMKFISEWIKLMPYDFRDMSVANEMRILTEKCVKVNPSLENAVAKMLEDLDNYLASDDDGSTSSEKQKDALPSSNLNPKEFLIELCPNPVFLAHQLTAVELEYLSRISQAELLETLTKDFQTFLIRELQPEAALPSTDALSPGHMPKIDNLNAYIKWFVQLKYLSASEILKYQKKKQRAKAIEYWIEAARECFNIGNFNSLMAILTGLNLPAVSRLKKTWSKVKSAKFSILEHHMDPKSDFDNYRSTMKAAVWRSLGVHDERVRIIIPFFMLFLRDLYISHESSSQRLQNGHVDFQKCSYFSKQIKDFNNWKEVICPYQKLPDVIRFLQGAGRFSEDALSSVSFEYEPPDDAKDKSRFKLLKSRSK